MLNMSRLLPRPSIDLNFSSGKLFVTIHPKPGFLRIIFTIVADIFFVLFLFRFWASLSIWVRSMWSLALGSDVLWLTYQLGGEETVEVDATELTIRKGIHGWERTREYKIEDCRELEWDRGSKNRGAGLKCKVGWRTIYFGEGLTEEPALEILASLQKNLPDVAQRICSYPQNEHFLTLGLRKR